MVDSIGSSTQIQNISGSNKTQKTAATEQENTDTRTISDDVSLSPEALDLSQTQAVTKSIAAQLSQDSDLTLSGDNSEGLNALI